MHSYTHLGDGPEALMIRPLGTHWPTHRQSRAATWGVALREQQQQVVWDTRSTAPGSYTVTLQHKGRQLRTEKLILRP